MQITCAAKLLLCCVKADAADRSAFRNVLHFEIANQSIGVVRSR